MKTEKMMKNLLCKAGFAALAAGLMTGTGNAQNLISVDELFPAEGMTQGGIWTSNGVNRPLVSHIGLDPSGTGLTVLYYDLPAIFAIALRGDVLMTDSWESGGTNDVLRFDGSGHLIFYSLGDTNGVGGADLLAANYAVALNNAITNSLYPFVVFNELSTTGGEAPPGMNYLNYTPLAGSGIGYVGGGPPGGSPSYLFISDVPEPATVSLIALGAGAAILWRRKTRAS
jgi:hypothetical protein